ncbi:heparin lyase I family protein [Leisingera caerulea]|uniref:heparin lyase I family protein n=1 Tax=Leisingera caerulea TaxID=506591 RepID=UPI0013788305|nr:heparin lyase I family protein [Leisingera caerulea]
MRIINFFTISAVAFFSVTSLAFADRPPKGFDPNMRLFKDAFRYSVAGEPVRRGHRSERYELRNGFCTGSDCRNNRLRSEIRESKRATTARIGKDIWFGWSFFVSSAPSLPGKDRLYPFFGQWKMGGDNFPLIAFVQSDHGSRDAIFVSLIDMSRASTGGLVAGAKHGNVCKDIFRMAAAKRSWIDIVVNTNFAADETGYVRVWINGQLKCDYSGQIVVRRDRSRYPGPNHRRGIYVGNTSYWKEKYGNRPVPTWVVYYDEFLTGKNREDVDTRMRERAGLPPVD